jgi:hypothetical protein
MITHVRPARTTRPWCTDDTLTNLRFIVRPDVDAWVPSIRELTRARDEHQERKLDAARAAAGLPADSAGQSMVEDSSRGPIRSVRLPSGVTVTVDPWRGS